MSIKEKYEEIERGSPSLAFAVPLFLILFVFAVIAGIYLQDGCQRSSPNSFLCINLDYFVFGTAFIVFVLIYVIPCTKKYKEFQNSKKIAKLTLILEIILTPIIGIFLFFLTSILSAAMGYETFLFSAGHWSLGGLILVICVGIVRNIFSKWNELKSLDNGNAHINSTINGENSNQG